MTLILTFAALTGETSVPATSQVIVCATVPKRTCGTACEVTRNGPASGATVTLVEANPIAPPPGLLSRAVRRKFSVRSPSKPTQSLVGSHSEKHSRVTAGSAVGAVGGVGHVPVAALVLLARIWSMSGKTRVGLLLTAFSPGELYFSVSVALTSAALPNWRNSGPLVLSW